MADDANEFNLSLVFETIADVLPDRECVVTSQRRLTFAGLADRSRRLANYLHGRGLRVHAERSELANHESGQDHVGLYLYNGTEYLEGMLGTSRARVANFNVNYRYVEEELRYLFGNAGAKGVIYHAAFAPTLAAVLGDLPDLDVLLQVADDSDNDLLPGAVDYEEALAAASPDAPPVEPSPDDLYILYTGGTTGMPKGVLWRQHDIFMSAMGGRVPGLWEEVHTYDDVRARAEASGVMKMMPIPPLMHGAAQWACFILMTGGGTVVMPETVTRLDAADVLRTVEREQVTTITVVGDAIARPIVDEIERGDYDLSSLLAFGNGGAPLTPALKERILTLVPHVMINDSVGSSETGAQATHMSAKGSVASGKFNPGPGATVVSEDLSRLLEPGDEDLGWLAQSGWVPLGYLADPDKTARTFPEIDGVRYAVPGDRARRQSDGGIELLGRDSVTINSGGEKIFAEEVEQAIAHHPAVYDVVVVGRPSERWGQEVVALVVLADGQSAGADELTAEASHHVARYKLPKAWLFLPALQRSPAGKADYRWAKEQAAAASGS